MNILITNSGRKNYLIDFLLQIKKKYIKNLKIHVSDINKNCSTFHINRIIKKHIVPSAKNKKKYQKAILKIINKNKIKVIIPVTNIDLIALSEIKLKIRNLNCVAFVSDKKIIKICLNKKLTSEFLAKNEFKSPNIFNRISKKITFPVILKDLKGNGSRGLFKANNYKSLKSCEIRDRIIQKFLNGQEYNIDILNDLNGNYLDHCSKVKLEMRDGETFKAKVIKNKKLEILAKRISKKLKHLGNLDCDIILYKKHYYIIDFNPRFGGGYPFTHLSGKNYLLKLLTLVLNKKYNLLKSPKLITGMKALKLNYYL